MVYYIVATSGKNRGALLDRKRVEEVALLKVRIVSSENCQIPYGVGQV